ncbi:uncharacterized protein KGF55_004527 [Candida pseudojiufengensis]|uniref:uncharacterized protein n=1 Tax=Candida pseudojiufengensis TaxID=497109 RepID=UPI0022244F1E|nr:uncharacterized protein KGF55_004527 [Candida pseudojiufengensis]KAI5960634.1 hypothetical protein KGF55_004527 [Candida pseudojiufengensis]
MCWSRSNYRRYSLNRVFPWTVGNHILARGIKLEYGVLLGNQDGENYTIVTSFGFNKSHLHARFIQLQQVYPQCIIIGIYQIIDSNINSSTIKLHELNKLCQTFELPIISSPLYLTYSTTTKDKFPFKAYSLNTNTNLDIKLAINETENIVVSTIDKYKNYTSNKVDKQTDLSKHLKELKKLNKKSNQALTSEELKQIEYSVSTIDKYKNYTSNKVDKQIDLSKHLKELKKLNKNSTNQALTPKDLQQIEYSKHLNLQFIQLALLTEQKINLDKVNHQFVKLWRLS